MHDETGLSMAVRHSTLDTASAPVDASGCEYCGASTDGPHQARCPSLKGLRFYRLHCGRLAARAEARCLPEAIPGS
jgi:hypothetical protein